MDDSVLPLHLVCCLRHQLSWRLLSHNIFLAVLRSELISWIGLAKAELLKYEYGQETERRSYAYLLDIYWQLNFRHRFRDIPLQRRDIYWLSHNTGHCVFRIYRVLNVFRVIDSVRTIVDILARDWRPCSGSNGNSDADAEVESSSLTS
jgi:hypothetical protein